MPEDLAADLLFDMEKLSLNRVRNNFDRKFRNVYVHAGIQEQYLSLRDEIRYEVKIITVL